MVINDKIAFIPIPKNASWSVESTCKEYNFDLKYSNILWENTIRENEQKNKHIHTKVQSLIKTFGDNLDYVCIIRDSTDRLISAWKFFITQSYQVLDSFTLNKMKSKNNEFIINFIKNNYNDFINAYGDKEIKERVFRNLIDELEFPEELKKDNKFIDRFSLHILTFISQYNWVLNDTVKVKEFHFDRIEEFESYISEKLNVDFKLLHANQTKIDYCAVTKTPELIEFVDKYIDGAIKRKKSLI
jgi:hypothetical protein